MYAVMRAKEDTVSKVHFCTALAALTYVIAPFDLIPDTIPFVGFTADDIMVVRAAQWPIKFPSTCTATKLIWMTDVVN